MTDIRIVLKKVTELMESLGFELWDFGTRTGTAYFRSLSDKNRVLSIKLRDMAMNEYVRKVIDSRPEGVLETRQECIREYIDNCAIQFGKEFPEGC